MTLTRIFPLATAAIALGACSTINDVTDNLTTEQVGEATLSLANGQPAGTVQLLNTGNEISVAVAVAGIDPGQHGFHLHTTGRCTAPDFTSAGGHLNPTNETHGSLSPGGKHLGDMPNLTVGSNRTGSTEVDLNGDPDMVLDAIFDSDGTAVVIHAGPDDYRTDPAGDAGSRVACGVLTRS